MSLCRHIYYVCKRALKLFLFSVVGPLLQTHHLVFLSYHFLMCLPVCLWAHLSIRLNIIFTTSVECLCVVVLYYPSSDHQRTIRPRSASWLNTIRQCLTRQWNCSAPNTCRIALCEVSFQRMDLQDVKLNHMSASCGTGYLISLTKRHP